MVPGAESAGLVSPSFKIKRKELEILIKIKYKISK